jgi:hypothetical protein
MDTAFSLDALVAEVVNWGGIAHPGPLHPTGAAKVSEGELNAFLRGQPCVLRDPTYVLYLQRYNGVGCNHPDRNLVLSLPGLSYFLTDIIANGYPLLDEAQYFLIGESQFTPGLERDRRHLINHAFYLDGSGDRPVGVYRGIIRRGTTLEASPPELYCGSFLDLLQQLVHHRGQVP